MNLSRTRLVFLVIMSAVPPLASVRCAFGVPSEQAQGNAAALPENSEGIITGLNPNILICTLAKERGLSAKRDKMGGGEAEPVKETEEPKETLSLVRAPNLERWGPRFSLRTGDAIVGILQIGVFADPNIAGLMFQDQVRHTSMGPNKGFGSEFGDQAVGWWMGSQQGFDRIVLRRRNVVASVGVFSARGDQKAVPLGVTLKLAQRLDSALKAGSDGVRRGTTLKAPRILAIELPKTPAGRGEKHAQVRIRMPQNAQADKSDEVEVLRDLPFYPPVAVGDTVLPESELQWELVHITADCVVSCQLVQVEAARVPSAQ